MPFNFTPLFFPGTAVYYHPDPKNLTTPLVFIPAIVVRMHAPTKHKHARHTLRLLTTGKQFVTTRNQTTWRAYCEVCSAPAYGAETPVCPSCGQVAIDKPPPIELVKLWDPSNLTWMNAMGARRTLVDGLPRKGLLEEYWRQCTQVAREEREARERRREQIMREIMEIYRDFASDDGDPDEDDPDNTGLIVAPKWAPPASDQTPDGADDFTRWLEGQFTRKAA